MSFLISSNEHYNAADYHNQDMDIGGLTLSRFHQLYMLCIYICVVLGNCITCILLDSCNHHHNQDKELSITWLSLATSLFIVPQTSPPNP